jgi:hypothetical protein
MPQVKNNSPAKPRAKHQEKVDSDEEDTVRNARHVSSVVLGPCVSIKQSQTRCRSGKGAQAFRQIINLTPAPLLPQGKHHNKDDVDDEDEPLPKASKVS